MSDARDELIAMLQRIREEREAQILELLAQRGKDIERIGELEAEIRQWREAFELVKVDIAETHRKTLAMIERAVLDDDKLQ